MAMEMYEQQREFADRLYIGFQLYLKCVLYQIINLQSFKISRFN
jgi:hypothetical protein